MKSLVRFRRLSAMLDAPDAERSTAPEEIDGQEVIFHKRANLFPRSQITRHGDIAITRSRSPGAVPAHRNDARLKQGI